MASRCSSPTSSSDAGSEHSERSQSGDSQQVSESCDIEKPGTFQGRASSDSSAECNLSQCSASASDSESSDESEWSKSSSPGVVLYDAQGNRIAKRQRKGQRAPPKKRMNPGSQPEEEGFGSEKQDQDGCGEESGDRCEDFGGDGGMDNEFEGVGRAGAAATAAEMEDFVEGVEPLSDGVSDDDGPIDGSRPTQWRRRAEAEYDQYRQRRPLLAQELLRALSVPDTSAECSRPECANSIEIKCKECGCLCATCDQELHPHAHFHHRWFLRDGQWWDPIGPDVELREAGLMRVTKVFATLPSQSCNECNWSSAQPTREPLTVITLEGRFDFFKAVHSCCTEGCGNQVLQDCPAALQLGFWPGTVTRMRTVYDTALLQHWEKASKAIPGSSLAAFVGVLEETGREQGRNAPINRHTMSLAFGEFKFAHFELKYFDNHRSGLDCPACYKRMHSIMCDGNHKLYRWDRAYEEFRECYYGELLLYSDADVQESLAHLDLALGNRRPDTCCGSGQWKAARDSKSAIRGQTETGSVLCGCRHQFAMKGVNMQFSGERYGYAYYLDRHFMQAKKVDFIWQDIICKYWEWRKKALEKSGHGDGAGMRPALNLMHGKLHSWECQVLFGGQWQDGAAAGSGEDMELLFSSLSRLGIITKLMGAARQAEAITEAALYSNEGKLQHLARLLAKRYEECLRRLDDAAAALEAACEDILGVPAGEVPLRQFEEMKQGVQAAARQRLERTRNSRSDGVEYFVLYTELGLTGGIKALADSDSFSDGALCSEKVQTMQQLTLEMSTEIRAKKKKLVELGKKLFGPDFGEGEGSEEHEQVLRSAREQLAEQTVQQLQIDMEGMLHSLERYKMRVSKEADSAKMRLALRKKEGEVKKQVVAAVSRYNKLLEMGILGRQRQPAQADSLLAGDEPPWAFKECRDQDVRIGSSVHRTVQFQKRLQLLEAYNRLRRLEEEKELLSEEKASYLSYYADLLESLDRRIEDVETRFNGVPTCGPPESQAVEDQVEGKYVVSEGRLLADPRAASGFLAALRAARSEAKVLLEQGVKLFDGGRSRDQSRPTDCQEDLFDEVEIDGVPTGVASTADGTATASTSTTGTKPLYDWLVANKLKAYMPCLVAENLTVDALKFLSNSDLKSLGVPLWARLRLLEAAHDLP